MNPATDAQNLVDYLHLRHACDLADRAGRGALRAKFGWSKERYSHALSWALDPSNGPLLAVTDALSSPLVPVGPPSANMVAILAQIAIWSVEMAKTSRKRHALRALQAATLSQAEARQ